MISRSPSQIQPVLDTIVETAAKLCDAKRASIYRYDGAVLRHQASHNASSELLEFLTRNPISPGRHSGVARAAVEKRTIHISDVRSDPEYTFGGAHVDPIRTVLAVPMLKASDMVGVLVIYRLEVRPFTDKQIELVHDLCRSSRHRDWRTCGCSRRCKRAPGTCRRPSIIRPLPLTFSMSSAVRRRTFNPYSTRSLRRPNASAILSTPSS